MDVKARVGSVLVLGALLISLAARAAEEPELTAPERAQVGELVNTLQKECHAAIAKLSKQQNAPSEGVAKAFASLTSDAYCDCVGARTQSEFPPTLVRHPDGAALQAFLKPIANGCAMAQFKISWPQACQAMTQDAGKADTGHSARTEQTMNKVCACVQPKIDAFKPEDLPEIMRQSAEDYREYQRDPAAFTGRPLDTTTRPLSFVRAMSACIASTKSQAGTQPGR